VATTWRNNFCTAVFLSLLSKRLGYPEKNVNVFKDTRRKMENVFINDPISQHIIPIQYNIHICINMCFNRNLRNKYIITNKSIISDNDIVLYNLWWLKVGKIQSVFMIMNVTDGIYDKLIVNRISTSLRLSIFKSHNKYCHQIICVKHFLCISYWGSSPCMNIAVQLFQSYSTN